MWKMNDLTGQTFGKLSVLKQQGKDKHGKIRWECVCDCGATTICVGSDMVSGKTTSCGCKVRTQGGLRVTEKETYAAWSNMIARCTKPTDRYYPRYGGRGIHICERWLHSFQDFLEDMGSRPKGLTLDRIDNDKGYAPDNCHWVDLKTQANNRCDNRTLTHEGVTLTAKQWANRKGLKYRTLLDRLNRGWSVEDTLEKPVRNWIE